MTQAGKSTSSKAITGLALPFYETALEFTEGMASGRLHQLVKYPSAVIVLVSTSLDAYINETLTFFQLMELESNKRLQIAALRKRRSREKWVRAPKILAGEAFDINTEP